MTPRSDLHAVAEPRWLERWRIKRAGRRDRLAHRSLPFSEHTPWTRQLHAFYAGLALDERRTVLDRRDEIEQERDRLQVVLRQPRSTVTTERPTPASDSRERHLWATEARRVAEESERLRTAHVRLSTIEAELDQLSERESHVVSVHEQAYLLRVHRYNAARAVRNLAAGAALAAPSFVLPSTLEADQPQLFDYTTAA